MNTIPNIPGCTFAGYVTNQRINHGQSVPLFVPTAPAWKPDINTVDGWNLAANKQNRRSFFSAFGREPTDNTELYNWVYDICYNSRGAQMAVGQTLQKTGGSI